MMASAPEPLLSGQQCIKCGHDGKRETKQPHANVNVRLIMAVPDTAIVASKMPASSAGMMRNGRCGRRNKSGDDRLLSAA
jgi:hypothetical protein